MDEYNHKVHEQELQRLQLFVTENNVCLNNSNGQRTVTIGGVIDIKTAYNAKDKIMLAFKLLAINSNNSNNEKKKNTINTVPTVSSIASNFNYDNDDGCLFYHAVRMAYDQSEDVRTSFRNNPSKITPNNAALWPLCYQAYKEYSI